jgi:hypothetical protein
MTNIILKDVPLIKALPLQYAYLPDIRGTRDECIDKIKRDYPWLDCEAWYHPQTATAFVPVDWVRK